MINRLNINKMKKLVILLLIMFLAISKGFSQEIGDFVVENVVYEVISLDEMTLRAIGIENVTPNVTIPYSLEYGGRTFHVTEADLTYHTNNIRTLNLCEGLIYLNLTSSLIQEINIPSTVTSIGTISSNNIFRYLRIPQNVSSIQKCSIVRIKYLEIEDANSVLELYSDYLDGTFYNVPIDTLYLGRTCWSDSWSTITDHSFDNCHIKDIRIGNDVKSIPRFSNSDISKIVLPSSIEVMISKSFLDCANLETVFIEDCAFPITRINNDGGPIIQNTNIKDLYLGRGCKWLGLSDLPLEKLSIGPGVTDFHSFYKTMNDVVVDIYGDSSYVKVFQTTPPDISFTFSTRTFIETPLYVPNGTKELFLQANVWKNFFNIIEFDWENPKCCVSLSVNNDYMGSVSGQNLFDIGELVTVSAIPNEDYIFVNWTENDSIVSADSIYSFVAEKTRILVANFVSNQCTVSIHNTLGGYSWGGGQYQYGDTVTIQAYPYNGYVFDSWLSYEGTVADTISYDNPYSFVITQDMEFYALFSMIPIGSYSVTASSDPINGGRIEGVGIYDGGTIVIVNAIPNPGFSFVNWTENGNIVSNSTYYQFLLNENKELVAHFSGLGVEDNMIEVSVYPNPTDGLIKIEDKEVRKIEIYNDLGQLVKESKENVIDLSAQEAGTYILKVITPSGVVTKQIIKN